MGDNGVPDLYEQPFHRVDFVYRETLGDIATQLEGTKTFFRLEAAITIGDKVVFDVRPGSQFTLNMSYNF